MILTTFPTDILERDEKSSEPSFWTHLGFKFLFLASLCLFFVSCASKPDRQFTYDSSVDASQEIQKLQAEMTRAESEQIVVLAPNSYMRAKRSIDNAMSLQDRGSGKSRVLDSLGDARSYFEQAKVTAGISQRELPGVLNARENALIAGASRYERSDLRSADRKLVGVTSRIEKKDKRLDLSVDDRANLQNQYLNLELKSIKSARLGGAQSRIEEAKDRGAQKFAPRTLSTAESKLKNAELTINTDRHNDGLISSAAMDADREAQRLQRITELSRRSGGSGNEPLAIAVVERDERIEALNRQKQQEAMRAQQSEMERQKSLMEAQKKQGQLTETQQALEARRQVDEAYKQAQNAFAADEAEVFRQGDNLILRMKSVRFPVGRSEVPASAYGSLNKVRDVIQNMNANRVVVEGHADATGKTDFNMKLSKRRAEAVSQYLRQQMQDRRLGGAGEKPMVEEIQFESRGFGSEHPVMSNRTRAGREANRRVDIVISPNLSMGEAPQSDAESKTGT